MTCRMWLVVVVGLALSEVVASWNCPHVSNVSCSCDIAHTLRCTGPESALPLIAKSLRGLTHNDAVSLLDCTIQGLTHIRGPFLEGVSLHGLVVSSGILRSVDESAFNGLKSPLQALGFPNNQLTAVPILALSHLPQLTRLDLSHNSIQSLSVHTLQGLSYLKLLDLSFNQLSYINPSTFVSLRPLQILRLQSNSISKDVVSKLEGLLNLEQLDLANNTISGPLDSMSFPRLPKLRNLNLAHNQISSITKGSFAGLDAIEYLSLEYNMIDVLEDHAFRAVSTLTSLILAHNRIVAISESSLAHLKSLTHLDLSHNFLRALTSDLISPLHNLTELHLDDNDISMIMAGPLETAKRLKVLTLSENPLNCDCSLAEFAVWVKNSSLKSSIKKTAVCATPPSLENGLVEELSTSQLICDNQDGLSSKNGQRQMPMTGTRVTLQGFYYNGNRVSLLWAVKPVRMYYCKQIFIYEELGNHEVLIQSNVLQCNSSDLNDPQNLPISLNASSLQKGHNYRYCIAVVETDSESALVLGCSKVVTLHEATTPQIIFLQANATNQNDLLIRAHIWPETYKCTVKFLITVETKLIHQSSTNCSAPQLSIANLPTLGAYNICASVSDVTPVCITQSPSHITVHDPYVSLLTILFFVLSLVLIITVVLVCKYVKKKISQPKLREQLFLPSPQNELLQHARYIKLQTTTNL